MEAAVARDSRRHHRRPPRRRGRPDRRRAHRGAGDRRGRHAPRASISTGCANTCARNQSTCINQRPLVRVGDVVQAGEIIADGPVHGARRTGAGPQRAVRVHALEWLQLRGFDPDLRAHRARRRVHLHPHRGIRGDGARHQARPGGNHPRHSERGRGSAEEPRRSRHRLYRRRGEPGRHPGRQGHAEGRKPDDAGRKAAARDLRRKGRPTCATPR